VQNGREMKNLKTYDFAFLTAFLICLAMSFLKFISPMIMMLTLMDIVVSIDGNA